MIADQGKAFILVAAMGISSFQATRQATTDKARLEAILKRSEEYCRKLEKAALGFVCLEAALSQPEL